MGLYLFDIDLLVVSRQENKNTYTYMHVRPIIARFNSLTPNPY